MERSPEERVREIVNTLVALGTEQRRASTERFIPTAVPCLGVSAPDMRRLARRLGRELEGIPASDAKAVVFGLVGERTLEVRQVAYLLLERLPVMLASLDRDEILSLGEGMDNWGTVDAYGLLVLGAAWLRGHVDDALLRSLVASPDRWWRRAALVATVALNKKSSGGTGDRVRTLDLCARLADDRDDMVVKGLSWALRQLATWDPAAVWAFLDEHDAVLAARIKREVGNKLRTGRKSG